MPNPSSFPQNENPNQEKEPSAFAQNRAFRYGDALFETLLVRKGKVFNAEAHLNRMLSGMDVLGFAYDKADWRARMHRVLQQLSKEIPDGLFGRIRIQVYRTGGGSYLPESDLPDFVAEVTILPNDPWQFSRPLKIGIYEDVPLTFSPLSAVKSTNALPFILAARYARQQGWDDALLRSSNGPLAESTKSNLFYTRESRLITPPILSGCLPGTMRKKAIEIAYKFGYVVDEKDVSLADLADADAIFLTNAIRGLVPVEKIDGMDWSPSSDQLRTILMETLYQAY